MTTDQAATTLHYLFSAASQSLAIGFGIVIAFTQWRLSESRAKCIELGALIGEHGAKLHLSPEDITAMQSGVANTLNDARRMELIKEWQQNNRPNTDGSKWDYMNDTEFNQYLAGLAELIANATFVHIMLSVHDSVKRDIRRAFICLALTVGYFLIGLLLAYPIANSSTLFCIAIILGIVLSCVTGKMIWNAIKHELAAADPTSSMATNMKNLRGLADQILSS